MWFYTMSTAIDFCPYSIYSKIHLAWSWLYWTTPSGNQLHRAIGQYQI